MRLRIGKSSRSREREAAAEAAREALRENPDPAVAVVFSTEQYDPDLLAAALAEELGPLPHVGCSTAGVIAGRQLLTHGVAVGVLSGSQLRVGVAAAGPVSTRPRESGRRAVARALADLPLLSPERHRTVIVLPDAVAGNPTEVVRGAAEEGGSGVVWAGGGAGDNFRFGRTAQFASGRAYVDHVVVLVLDAPDPIGAGIRHGWRPLGPATLVTNSEGTRLIELDYENAFEVYRRTAAELGQPLGGSFTDFAMMHPLGIPQAAGDHLIRDPLEVDDRGAVHCVAEVPRGSLVQLMVGERGGLLAAAHQAASLARAEVGGTLGGAILFDCFSRYVAFGSSLEDELREVSEGLGGELPLVGCLTLGEVAAQSGVPQFHNKTTVVVGV